MARRKLDRPEPISFDDPGQGFSIRFTQANYVDNRRQKEYGLDITGILHVPESYGAPLSEVRYDARRYGAKPLRDCILDALVGPAPKDPEEGASRPRPGRTRTVGHKRTITLAGGPCSHCDHYLRGGDDFFIVSMTWKLRVDRPSRIPSFEEAVNQVVHAFGVEGDLFVPLVGAFQEALSSLEASQRRQRLHREATHLATWLGKHADEKARRIVRFDQRLAALVAELEAEQKVQLEEAVEGDTLEKAVAESGGEFLPGAIPNAKKFAERYLPPAKPGGLLRSSEDIKPEEIEVSETE